MCTLHVATSCDTSSPRVSIRTLTTLSHMSYVDMPQLATRSHSKIIARHEPRCPSKSTIDKGDTSNAPFPLR